MTLWKITLKDHFMIEKTQTIAPSLSVIFVEQCVPGHISRSTISESVGFSRRYNLYNKRAVRQLD